MIETILGQMTASQIAGGLALLIAALSAVIEIAPIKINPWTSLARKIGRAINGEVLDKVSKLEKDLQAMQETEDERAAKNARTRVLRFGDELLHDVQHSKEHFDDILQDISDYEKYCDEHPHFENNRMQLTSKHIKERYMKRMEQHDFL